MARNHGLAFAFLLSLVPAQAWAQTSLVSVSTYGNFQTAGVVVTISGDADQDAFCNVEYKRTTEASYHPGLTFRHLDLDPTHMAGSLFNLSSGTVYDVRVTLFDPDGVSGNPVSLTTVTTRADFFPEPTVQTLYVATTGNDSNPGTVGQPLRTIQRAEALAEAGTLVLIQPGVYREEVTVNVAGSASQPVVFRGNGVGVVLDGADATIAAGVAWTSEGGGVYSRALGFPTDHVVTERGRFYKYATIPALQGLGAGYPGGFHFDPATNTLRIKFFDNSAPGLHTLQVARLENGFHLTGAARYVRIENVEIRHYGANGFGKGVYLNRIDDAAVRACRIHEVESAGVWVKAGSRHVIEDNLIWDTSIFNWPWDLAKGSTAENDAVKLTDEIGRGHVIRRNTTYGTFNGIGPCGSVGPPGITTEVDVHHNNLSQHLDDALEPEGYCSNVRLFENRIKDVHMAFAVAPASPGPTYILRNVAYNYGNTRASQTDGYLASALKINSGFSDRVGPVFLFHNTFLTQAPNTDAVALLNPGIASYIVARNNVFAGTRYALYKLNTVGLDWFADDLYTTDPTRYVRWHDATLYPNLAAFQAGTGQEMPLGISAPPNLVNPAGGLYQPAAGSPLINAGALVSGLNDDFLGSAPDMGAIEVGTAPALPTGYFPLAPCRLVDT
ncbi:MAG TPA: right-handed parallel beta-helix repeat-containing protein, partial [Vicinamibacteria bacterium]